MKKDMNKTVKIVSNDAVVGKPYLDIDRVILEGKSDYSNEKGNDQR
ncbi:hypothetical protein [Bacillus salipaludis]|uniref:Uncharacterized protein n=1 Tax=Bacillus salipaludis TaxID=2547811 RepID=A0AA90R7I2_9BACI|nr:hypothetical protein [Bacillus salipaludis]MDQ6597543.1 hypothetical protein [Bacillus salipaludis]